MTKEQVSEALAEVEKFEFVTPVKALKITAEILANPSKLPRCFSFLPYLHIEEHNQSGIIINKVGKGIRFEIGDWFIWFEDESYIVYVIDAETFEKHFTKKDAPDYG